jgi:hypothetical protein
VPKSVPKKRITTDGRVVAGDIKSERGRTDGRVEIAVVLNLSAPAPMAVFNPPVVVLLSELRPTAVLLCPVVRLKRALVPSAVLPPG